LRRKGEHDQGWKDCPGSAPGPSAGWGVARALASVVVGRFLREANVPHLQNCPFIDEAVPCGDIPVAEALAWMCVRPATCAAIPAASSLANCPEGSRGGGGDGEGSVASTGAVLSPSQPYTSTSIFLNDGAEGIPPAWVRA